MEGSDAAMTPAGASVAGTSPSTTPSAAATISERSEPAPGSRPWRRHSPLALLAVIGGAQLMVILDTTVMIIALPSAQHALGFSNADRQWVITAYTVTFGGLLLLGGRLSDRFGAKQTLITGVIGFALASALGGAATSFAMLVFSRGLQGAFGALLAPSVLSLLTTTFQEPEERARAFGIYATIAISGAALGLILGGLLTQYLDWRWCLYVNVPISVVVAISASVLLPPHRGHPEVRIDVPGTVLGCGGLVALVYGLGDASTDGWGGVRVIATLVGAAVLLVAFVLVERKVPSPLLPLRILADRNRVGAYLSVFFAVIANYGMFLFLTYLMQTIKGFSPLETGFAFLPLMVANGVTATQIASRLMPKVPTRLLILPGLLIAAVGAGVLTQLHPSSTYATSVLPAELLLGLGLGLAFVPIMSTATARAAPRDAGVVSAMTNTSQQIGASVGTALLNTIAASATAAYLVGHVHGPGSATSATVHGYAVASAYSMGFLALAALVSGLLINARPAAGRPGSAGSG